VNLLKQFCLYFPIQVFSGNTDRNTVVTNSLEVPIKDRYVRFAVKEFYGTPAMRVELYGC
jgi:hypothetical protein